MTSSDRGVDAVIKMLDDLRATSIPLWDADRREQWFDALAQVVSALPSSRQRMAAVVLIANDLCKRVPDFDLPATFAYVQARLNIMED